MQPEESILDEKSSELCFGRDRVGRGWFGLERAAGVGRDRGSSHDRGGGLSNGFGTGCSYEVVANGATGVGMEFYDNGVLFAATEGSPTPKTHVARWAPATAGTHTILVNQNGDAKTVVLTVGTGINAGSSCLVI